VRDVLDIIDALDFDDIVYVGHSVSAMIGVLASNMEPERFARLVLIGPSPRYVDDGDYVGGVSAQDIEGLLASLDSNYLGWSMERPVLSLCHTPWVCSHSSSRPSCHRLLPCSVVRCSLGSASRRSIHAGSKRARSRAAGACSASRTSST
jgi:pimeloyl-ACP methyl ester carboxylesterase